MFHPAKSFVTVHNELAQLPEEFERLKKGEKEDSTAKQSHEGESFLSADEPPVIVPHTEKKYVSGRQALHSTLPFKGDLPELPHLPLLNHRGEQSSFTETNDVQREYIAHFREHVGGCDAKEAKRKLLPHGQGIGTDDLFCLPGKEPDYDDEDEDEEVALAIAKASDAQPSAG